MQRRAVTWAELCSVCSIKNLIIYNNFFPASTSRCTYTVNLLCYFLRTGERTYLLAVNVILLTRRARGKDFCRLKRQPPPHQNVFPLAFPMRAKNARSYGFYLLPRFCLPVAYRIRDKFLKKSFLSTPDLEAKFRVRSLSKLFFHPRHFIFFAQSSYIRPTSRVREERVVCRIWICGGRLRMRGGVRGSKYLEYRSVMCRWRGTSARVEATAAPRRHPRCHIARWILRGYLHERNILWGT
jgi:hypothetical protein